MSSCISHHICAFLFFSLFLSSLFPFRILRSTTYSLSFPFSFFPSFFHIYISVIFYFLPPSTVVRLQENNADERAISSWFQLVNYTNPKYVITSVNMVIICIMLCISYFLNTLIFCRFQAFFCRKWQVF